MKLHADLSRPVDVATETLAWAPSPAPGVMRRMIERDGQEQARCTSRVTYAPGSVFPPHAHPLGEEILVLSGTFHDEHGSYRAGTYLRNPDGAVHAPGSRTGCELLVKLRHLSSQPGRATVMDTESPAAAWVTLPAVAGHLRGLFLGGEGREASWLLEAAAGTVFELPHAADHPPAGEEVYEIATGQWSRRPPGTRQSWSAPRGGRFFVKVGHLNHGD
ncbi:MAG: cupin domain-containing protein [Gammaproteobacteria bacterium]